MKIEEELHDFELFVDSSNDAAAAQGGSHDTPTSTSNSSNSSHHPLEILHRIASYLSLGDNAENSSSMSASYSSSRGGNQNHHRSLASATIITTNSNSNNTSLVQFPSPSHHSLDYHYYHSITSITRMADNDGDGDENEANMIDSSYEKNSEDEEDWFVGGQHSINSVSAGCGVGGGTSLSLPLAVGTGQQQQNQHQHQLALEEELQFYNQQALLEEEGRCHSSSIVYPPPTPAPAATAAGAAAAGQATSEISEKEEQPASSHPQSQITCQCYNDNCCRNDAIINTNHYHPPHHVGGPDDNFDNQRKNQQRQKKQTKRALQNKLAAAVFSHPHPLRQYCLDAYATALSLSMERQKKNYCLEGAQQSIISPSSCCCCCCCDVHCRRHEKKTSPQLSLEQQHHNTAATPYPEKLLHGRGTGEIHILVHVIGTKVLHFVPLSVLLELAESTCDLSLNTLLATGRIGTFTINQCISMLCNTAMYTADVLSRVNPFHVFEFVVNAQRSAMGKTGDVLVSGIQSVATGVGSVSNAALNRLSKSGLALAGGVVGGTSRSGEMMGSSGFGRGRKDASAGVGDKNHLESKLFHRLQKMESVSKLVAYSERVGEEAFSRHAKKRAQRMMHYNVSFRPFTATIQPGGSSPNKRSARTMKHNVSFEVDAENNLRGGHDDDNDSVSSESLNSSGSIFMRTPTSFPPTPTSRLYYFERGSQFTENVVFLARDQLRVERGVANHNEQTRAMSKALIDGSRLAVFDAANNVGNGIALSCGQHIATKVGNALYCSTRSMIPVMRNSYVYFEISVSPSTTMNAPSSIPTPQVDATTLLVGLSTLEMPLDTLVGAWKGSVGLCSTGQILDSGQWYSPSNQEDSSYGSNSTVGCLVYLDDNSAYETSEGPNVTLDVTFSINGRIVPSYECSGASSDQSCPDSPERLLGASGDGCEPTLSLIVPKSHELFPTVTLHSSGTSVMCRFSAEDLLANSRAEIGALSGVVVYAVDGSVILDESEEDEFLDSSSRCNEFLYGGVAL
ncbi:hypothetical protein ACHAXR_005481 [Thalassiosira sp. AJA248-18]